jgi:hypothetical protein
MIDLNALRLAGVLSRSSISDGKAAKARRILDFMSDGGSLEIFMHV